MANEKFELDSGILQITPKGAYYEESNEQLAKVIEMWLNLLTYDRTLFCLTTLLKGTGYAKGSMNHLLLSNPQPVTDKALIKSGISFDYETKVILYNLYKEATPRALKNLLMLAGFEGKSRVNNARSRKIILQYIFDRDHDDLENLAINYKRKLKTLIRHAIGWPDLVKILNGDVKLFDKWIGRYNIDCAIILHYLYDIPIPKGKAFVSYDKVEQVMKLKDASIRNDVDDFKKYMQGLPILTVMGYRNTYKVDIDKSEIYEKTKLSTKQKIQMQTASAKAGKKVSVNYKKQDLYDLWKLLYHKVLTQDTSDVDKIKAGISYQINKADKIDLGEVFVIVDSSRSMYGSETRPLHPILTALSIVSVLKNIKDVIYVGGKKSHNIILPDGSTSLWRGLTEAVLAGAKKILIISDGYENSIKGMFNHVYNHFKNSGHTFELLHINPVMAADAQSGTSRAIADDVKVLPVSSYKFLETEVIFNQMIENRDMVKKLLLNKYKKLIEGGKKK